MPASEERKSPFDQIKRFAEAKRDVIAAAPKVIGEHTVKEGETLTHVTMRFYGEEGKPFWQYVYEFNKNVIGPDMKLLKPGMKLRIPELTPKLQAMKRKK
jgi:nucleoid-associated protein YgaU